MEDNKVYVVRRDYDDWDEHATQILGVFTNKETAEEYVERLNKNKGQYEEFYYESFVLDEEDEFF